MLNYKKFMELNPTEYERITNSKGQVIVFYEHPLRGDEAECICVCHELELAEYSGFMETNDMIADHKEYEPSFKDGKFMIGDHSERFKLSFTGNSVKTAHDHVIIASENKEEDTVIFLFESSIEIPENKRFKITIEVID